MARRVAAVTILLFVALATYLVWHPSPAVLAQTDPAAISLDEYQRRLAQAEAALAAGADLDGVAQALAAIDAVKLANGETVTLTPILEDGTDREAALQQLRALQAQLTAAADDRTTERLAQLAEVIDRLALDRPTLWQRIWRWFEDLLDALIPDRVPSGASAAAEIGSTLLVWTIVITGGGLLAFVLGYWFRRLFGGILADAVARRRQQDGDLPQTAAEAREQAQSFAGTGNYREAVRRLYLSALLHLDEAGLLRFQRHQTNREVLAQVRPESGVRTHLEPVVETFDRVWYGIREPDRQTFDAYQTEIDSLMSATGERTRE